MQPEPAGGGVWSPCEQRHRCGGGSARVGNGGRRCKHGDPVDSHNR